MVSCLERLAKTAHFVGLRSAKTHPIDAASVDITAAYFQLLLEASKGDDQSVLRCKCAQSRDAQQRRIPHGRRAVAWQASV
jgi:hypothetical protein